MTRMSDLAVGRELITQGLRLVDGICSLTIREIIPEKGIEDLVHTDTVASLVHHGLLAVEEGVKGEGLTALRTTPKGLIVLDSILTRIVK